jgi:hypothetical protein
LARHVKCNVAVFAIAARLEIAGSFASGRGCVGALRRSSWYSASRASSALRSR